MYLLFLGPNSTRFAHAISGPTPSNAPRNDVAPLKIITYRAIKTTGTLVVLCTLVLLCSVVVCCGVVLLLRKIWPLTGLKSPHWLAPWLSWLKRLSGKQELMSSNLIRAFIPLASPITLFSAAARLSKDISKGKPVFNKQVPWCNG